MYALATLAVGAAIGAAAEELIYRKLLPKRDPAAGENFGSIRGEVVAVRAFDDTPLHVESFGDPAAPAIVLVHGLCLGMDIWHYQLRDLPAAGWRVIAFDARGHGRSGPAKGADGKTPFNADTLAQDLWSVLHETNARPAVVVGHSMGGMTIQSLVEFGRDFASEFGDHVRGVVLVNTTFTGSLGFWRDGAPRFQSLRKLTLAAWEMLARQPGRIDRFRNPPGDLPMLATRMGFGADPSPSHVALTVKVINDVPSETLTAGVAALGEFEKVEGLSAIDVPTLIVAGERDLITPVSLAREMVARIPGAELVVFERAGHMSMLERHAEFTDLVSTFAKRVLES